MQFGIFIWVKSRFFFFFFYQTVVIAKCAGAALSIHSQFMALAASLGISMYIFKLAMQK